MYVCTRRKYLSALLLIQFHNGKRSKIHCVKPGDATGSQAQSLKFAHEAAYTVRGGLQSVMRC